MCDPGLALCPLCTAVMPSLDEASKEVTRDMAAHSNHPLSCPRPRRLYIVCCHAIFHGSNPLDEAHWSLASFQKGSALRPGEHHTFLAHIQAALQRLRSHSIGEAVLVFSGAATKQAQHPLLTEARSYLNAAKAAKNDPIPLENILLEENATDSYQNLLFSILVFRQRHGCYPESVVVVTHAFKRSRFRVCHAEALRWPEAKIEVLGIDPDWGRDDAGRDATMRGEDRCVDAWRADPYGTGKELHRKRVDRGYDPDLCSELVANLEEPVQRFLERTSQPGADYIHAMRLPWESLITE